VEAAGGRKNALGRRMVRPRYIDDSKIREKVDMPGSKRSLPSESATGKEKKRNREGKRETKKTGGGGKERRGVTERCWP